MTNLPSSPTETWKMAHSPTLVADDAGSLEDNRPSSKEGRGPLEYARAKDCDWKLANYPTFAIEIAWLLNEKKSELEKERSDLERLDHDIVSGGHNVDDLDRRKKKLMAFYEEKLLSYHSLLSRLRKTKSFEVPSTMIMERQRKVEISILGSEAVDEFAGDIDPHQYCSIHHQQPIETIAFGFLCLYQWAEKRSSKPLNSLSSILLALVLLAFFCAPMPILLFRALSVPSTIVLLIVLQVLFTVFIVGTQRLDFTFLHLVTLAYSGVMWSSASNWISAE